MVVVVVGVEVVDSGRKVEFIPFFDSVVDNGFDVVAKTFLVVLGLFVVVAGPFLVVTGLFVVVA